MKRLLILAFVALGIRVASAQPVPTGSLKRVAHGVSLSGDGTLSSPLSVRIDCADGETIVWNDALTTWECGSAGGSYSAGNGLSLSGSIFSVNNGAGLTFSTGALTYDNTVIQSRVSGTCTSPNAIASISATGAVTCTSGVSTLTNSAGANYIVKSDGTNLVPTLVTESAGIWAVNTNKATINETTGAAAFANTLSVNAGGANITGPVVMNTTTSNSPSLKVTYTGVPGESSDRYSIQAFNVGSYDSTAASRVAGVISATCTATRSAGSNAVTCKTASFDATGGTAQVALETLGGDVNLNATSGVTSFGGKVRATGTDPTISSCGTSPTVVGSDVAGIVTVGSGTATSCTVTFASTYSTEPACVVTLNSATSNPLAFSSKSATAFTVTTSSGGNLAGLNFNYVCVKM